MRLDTVRGEPFGRLRTGLSNHERLPFDKLRAEDGQLVFLVLAIDKLEDLAAYHSAMLRLIGKK